MAEVLPFRAITYAHDDAQAVTSPPYDVIDPEQRERLKAQSPHNVVEVDLPVGDDPYADAAEIFRRWQDEGVLTRDEEDAFWVLSQDYTGPDGKPYTRTGFFGRVRVEEYGAGRVRPHERTHPGPKEDRLRLTRATRANMSPIFVLYDDPEQAARTALDGAVQGDPVADVTDPEGTRHRLWRVADPDALAAVTQALAPSELLIADGHHRYETARVYADEIGGEGPHRYVLACLVALQDPGLTVFPTHRMLTDLKTQPRQEALRETLMRDFELEKIETDALEPPPSASGTVAFGFMDNHHQQAYRLTLKDPETVRAALPDASDAYRGLDTAVLEALILRGPLGMSEDDISHLNGLTYSRTFEEARDMILANEADAGFFMGAGDVEQIQGVAAAGEVMPPKSTFFYPKVLTGLLFHPLTEE